MTETVQSATADEVEPTVSPLPSGREYIAGMNRHFAKVCGTVVAYSEDDLRAYAAQEVAAEREACAQVAYDFPTMHGFHSCYGVADAIRNRAAEMNQIRSQQEPQQ